MNKPIVFLLFCLILTSIACHEHVELTETPFKYFQDQDNIIRLNVETNMSALLSDQEDYEYQPARLVMQKDGQEEEHFHIELKPRGVFRKANCSFPPLKIRFPDDVLEAGGFMDYPTLKLVTHCEAETGFDQLILKEHLIFKLYNELTENSFKTQLVKITYVDHENLMETIERYGFLIEHPRELADRMNGRILGETYGIPKTIHLPAYKTFVLFQYMIGNTDWGLSNRHNVKLIQAKQGDLSLPIPVPYDFDFCGMVNAPYAIPHHNHPIANVRERYFQWRGGETDFEEVFDLFTEKKPRLLDIVASCPQLTDSIRTDALDYLNGFFNELETPESIVSKN